MFSEDVCFNFVVPGTPFQAVQVHSISQCRGPPAPSLPQDGRKRELGGWGGELESQDKGKDIILPRRAGGRVAAVSLCQPLLAAPALSRRGFSRGIRRPELLLPLSLGAGRAFPPPFPLTPCCPGWGAWLYPAEAQPGSPAPCAFRTPRGGKLGCCPRWFPSDGGAQGPRQPWPLRAAL